MPPHQFWPRYHSDGLSPVHVRFEFFSKQICNVEALICHFYKNIKTLTQIHFPRDAHIFRTCTIFYRHYKGLHQMRKDLVLCAHKLNLRRALCSLCESSFLRFVWFVCKDVEGHRKSRRVPDDLCIHEGCCWLMVSFALQMVKWSIEGVILPSAAKLRTWDDQNHTKLRSTQHHVLNGPPYYHPQSLSSDTYIVSC